MKCIRLVQPSLIGLWPNLSSRRASASSAAARLAHERDVAAGGGGPRPWRADRAFTRGRGRRGDARDGGVRLGGGRHRLGRACGAASRPVPVRPELPALYARGADPWGGYLLIDTLARSLAPVEIPLASSPP